MVQNLPKKARITTDQVHKFFEEKGSHFERLRVENVVFVYDLGGLIHLIQKREQAIVELKKIEAKGEQEGVQDEEEQSLTKKKSKKEISRAIALEKKIGEFTKKIDIIREEFDKDSTVI